MDAALVEARGESPRFRQVPRPQPQPGQEVLEVLAVGVHLVTRAIAAGRHYAAGGRLPRVPGVDAVVRRADGTLAYVATPDSGTLAQRIAVETAAVIPMPEADPATLAASMIPAMSSWMVLRGGVPFSGGQSVLVIGATGTSGAIALETARHLGAGRIIAAGRNRDRLAALSRGVGAVQTVALTDDREATAAALAEAAADVDVVLDYVWGPPTELALEAILRNRADATQPLHWVQIGSLGGESITLPAAALRSNAIRLSGSGFGSIRFASLAQELPRLATAIAGGELSVRPRPFALADVESAWSADVVPGERIVIIP